MWLLFFLCYFVDAIFFKGTFEEIYEKINKNLPLIPHGTESCEERGLSRYFMDKTRGDLTSQKNLMAETLLPDFQVHVQEFQVPRKKY